MKAPKRDTHPKAADAARRSAAGPISSTAGKSRTTKEKPHAQRPDRGVAPRKPARPRKLKPAPPVTDCAKCSKLAEAKATAARWHALATKLQGEIDARTKAALAGVAVTLDAAAIAKAIEEVYHPCFSEVLAVSRDIALNPAAEDKDRLKAVAMIKDQVAGKVTDKVHHSGSIAGVALVTDFPVAGGATPTPDDDGSPDH